jgi:hypothetical protein
MVIYPLGEDPTSWRRPQVSRATDTQTNERDDPYFEDALVGFDEYMEEQRAQKLETTPSHEIHVKVKDKKGKLVAYELKEDWTFCMECMGVGLSDMVDITKHVTDPQPQYQYFGTKHREDCMWNGSAFYRRRKTSE